MTRTTHHRPLARVLTGILAATALAQGASAQTAPTWNRRLTEVSVVPDAAGGWEIRGIVDVTAAGLSAPIDLDTEMELYVNGTLVGTGLLEFEAGPAFGGGPCNSCPIGELCFCGTDPWTGVFSCQCGSIWSWLAWNHPASPGDEIMVLLRPAPGAVPEQDETDDAKVLVLDGPRAWDRRISSLSAVPRPGGGPGDFDLHVDLEVAANLVGLANLGADLEVTIDGVSIGAFPGPSMDQIVWSNCANACGDPCAVNLGGAGDGTCVIDDVGFGGCGCAFVPESDWHIELPPLDPPAIIGVVLRPAPGALPELPGFPDDEEEEDLCPTDLDGDGTTGFGDLLAVLAAWGPCAGDCPADLDDDDVVGFSDLLMILSAWGPCFPV